jgi:trimethylamine--corrinoid protein Co-methyltransferase
MKPKLSVLNSEELDAIYASALFLLKNVGVSIEDDDIVRLLVDGGCTVDENRIVCFPEWLVKDCVKSTPTEITLCGRDSAHDMTVGRQRYPYVIPIVAINYFDCLSNTYRVVTKDDVRRFVTLCDYLDSVDGVWMLTMMPEFKEMYMFCDFVMGIRNTTKPISIITAEPRSVEPTYELATYLAGGQEEMRKRPLLVINYCSISPLAWNKQECEMLKATARWGIQPAISTEAPTGYTGPITLAGNIAQKMAEFLSGDVILQLLNKGMPVIWCALHETFDLKTASVTFSSHADFVQSCAIGQLEKYIGIPTLSSVVPDSKLLDAQLGFELAYSLLTQMLGGSNLLVTHGLDSANAFSDESLLLLDDMVISARRILDGIDVSPDTLAQDIIAQVCSTVDGGRRVGHFVDKRHTLDWYEREHRPRRDSVVEKHTRQRWMQLGSKSFIDRAHERVEDILRSHRPEPLSRDIELKIEEIQKKYGIEGL